LHRTPVAVLKHAHHINATRRVELNFTSGQCSLEQF
jgi:hypothetical protein